jgi:hypothetical protein
MSVLSELKFGFLRRGGRNRFTKEPAKVTLVSWPSFAVYSYGMDEKIRKKKELTHVGGEEHPLRKSVVFQIFFKQCKVLDICSTLWNIGYRVINN